MERVRLCKQIAKGNCETLIGKGCAIKKTGLPGGTSKKGRQNM